MTHTNISRKAAQAIIRELKQIQAIAIKGNAKQQELIDAITLVSEQQDISSVITNAITNFPLVVKTKVSQPARTTKTIESDSSTLAQLKQAQQTIASLQAQLSKPQLDAESRLADALNELSETREALAYANQSLAKATRYDNAESARKLQAENTLLKHDLTDLGQELKRSQFALAESRQEIVKLTNQLELYISHNQLLAKENVTLVQQLEKERNVSTPPATVTQADKPRAITTIETLPTNCEIDGKPAYAMPGLASVFCLSLPELERMVRRLVTQGFAQLHIDTQQMIDKFTDDGIRYQLTDGSFFLTLR